MIIGKMLFARLALIAVLYPGMVPTVSAQASSCKTPDNRSGICINIKECPLLLSILQTHGMSASDYLQQSLCHFDGTNAIVCCPIDKNLINNGQDQLLQPPHCGFSNASHDRVVGGVPAELGAWPWIAALGFRYRDNPSQVKWHCGGSLISSRHVLTAAHCAISNDLSVVRIGDLNLKRSDDGAHPVQVKIARKIIHPLFTIGMYVNDIAVLELAEDVPFSQNLRPICLPVEPTVRTKDLVGYHPFVAGWGSQALRGQAVDTLMEVQVPVISNDECRRQYSKKRGAVIDNRVICAGYTTGGKDACQGDSGGPLMFPRQVYFYQIGVVSYGFECALPGYAGVYTRVTEFLDFIISAMQ